MVQLYQFQPTLTIMSLTVKEAESRVNIVARPRGLAGMILHALGIGSQHKLSMSPAGFRLNNETIFGHTYIYCPKEHVAATVYMLQRPIVAVSIWLGIGLALAFTTYCVSVLVCGIIGLIIYYISKERVTIGIVSDGGTGESLKLEATAEQKRSLVRARKIMESLVGAEKQSDDDEELAAADEEPAPQQKSLPKPKSGLGDNSTTSCPSCQAQLRVPAAMRGRTVSCPTCKQAFQV